MPPTAGALPRRLLGASPGPAARTGELDPYEAGGAYATVEGEGEIAVELDGNAATQIEIDGPGLYKLAEHRARAHHRARPSTGLRIWSVSFAAGVRRGGALPNGRILKRG